MEIITRFAPSPTGKAHAGGYRTAMYAWLFAKKNNGKFILRIEDTDIARNQKDSETDIYEALQWIGLTYDSLYIQSKNLTRHQEIIKILIDNGNAYISHEEAKDGSGTMKDIIRFKNPGKIITFTDLIRGDITIDTTDLGDFVIARNINEPVYHLAVVVDDHDEGVSHIIRAEEHIANTPRHILIHQALGWTIPQYAHLPLVLDTERQKLSKRRGALAMTDYRNLGYLPQAVFNYVAMLGWNPADPGSDQEIFSVDELINRFDFSRMQKSGAIFNPDKLKWFNREYIKQLSVSEKEGYFKSYAPDSLSHLDKDVQEKLIPIIFERIDIFSDISSHVTAGEYNWLINYTQPSQEMIVWKNDSWEKTKNHLHDVKNILETLKEIPYTALDASTVKNALITYAEEQGKGSVLAPLRMVLSGQERSPDPTVLISLLGIQESCDRINNCIIN